MEDILIKIAADTKELVRGLADIEDKGGTLKERLTSLGEAAAVAFAGFSASILGSVYAFRQQEQASIQVNQILFATGGIAGVTAEAVHHLAESLSEQTIYSEAAVTKAEAVLLTYTRLGEHVFPEATKATADLAATMGIGLTEAANIVGRALQNPDNAARSLRQAHIQLTSAQQAQIRSMILQGNTAGAQGVILQALEGRFGGMSQAVAGGTGVFEQLKNVMEKLAEKIGEELAPAVIKGATWLRDFIQVVSRNESLTRFIADGIALATVFTGLVTAIAAATAVINLLSPAMKSASVIARALGISIGEATMGIGFLIIAAAELYQHWNVVWPACKAIFQAFVQNISGLAMGLAKMLIGATTLDLDLIKEGWAQAKLAIMQGVNTVSQAITTATKQREINVAAAENDGKAKRRQQNLAYQRQIEADERAHQDAVNAAERAANQATLLEMQHHSALLVGLKKQEATDLKILADESFRGNKAAVHSHLDEVRALYTEASATEKQRLELADKINLQEIGVHNAVVVQSEKTKLALLEKMADVHYQKDRAALQSQIAQEDLLISREQQKELKARQTYDKQMEKTIQQYHLQLTKEEQAYLLQREQAQLTSIQTHETAEGLFLAQQIQMQTQAHNQLLQDQIQFGNTYAELNQVMHSTIFQGSKTAFGDLENLTQSHNNTLKSIGKAAAAANIIMKTYESAMNIFAGFSTIPFVGYALGIAGAAAAVAFGIEQLGQIQGMAAGGLVAGGLAGRDSVPLMAMPGELVVPKQNFNDVVSSYAKNHGGTGSGGQQQPQRVSVDVQFHGDASRMLQVKNIRDQSLGVFRGKT